MATEIAVVAKYENNWAFKGSSGQQEEVSSPHPLRKYTTPAGIAKLKKMGDKIPAVNGDEIN